MAKKSEDTFQFEEALTELQTIVSALEQGQLPLDDSLKRFEQGIKLVRQCQNKLKDTEQKVKILMENNATADLQDFDADCDND